TEAQDSAGEEAGGRGEAAEPRPYDRVITPEAVSDSGLFITHRIGEKLFFEIPRAELGKDMLVISRTVAGGQRSGFFGGGGNRVVTWELEANRILLRGQSYDIHADSSTSIFLAVSAMRAGPIIASFNVESWGPDSAAVIDVTKLYTTDIPEFAVVDNPESDRSFIESVVAFPENVNVEATQTGTPQQQGGEDDEDQPETLTARVLWSMIKLPEDPMMPRLHDRRVGYGSVTTIDYSRPEHQAKERRYIRRFRLVKQNPGAAVSDPVEPIVFWIDPATPDWLVPWVEVGIEAWQPAFREAGFSNAIVAREAPPNDSTWSKFDARYSIVYWRPSTVANATGGQVVDPRTGEILKAEVNMYHNVQELLRNWYFTQVGPLDPRARSLPLPDSLMGRLVEYVVTHEVGHAIGFPHNMKASAMYPADSLRSESFLRRMGGHVATLMDYSRFNYVAQPEDSIPPELLIPHVGPYDRFAVRWGHTPIPGADTPDEEWPTLDKWSRMQDTIPWFRFTTQDAPNDPFALTEAVGDADAVKSNSLGLKNLERVMDMMLDVAEKPGHDYELLSELYQNAISQWGRYNGHVAALVGSAETQERYGTGPRFDPVSEARQREAVRFLNMNAFHVPEWLIDEDILRRIEAVGIVDRSREAQAGVLNSLLGENRLNRMIEYEALSGDGEAYSVAELLADLETGVWSELDDRPVAIDVFRRNLQRAYLEAIDRHVNPPPPGEGQQPQGPGDDDEEPYPTDARAALRGHLVELDRAIEQALPRAADGMTRLHLRDLGVQIERILNPVE
ncbi:MAG: zinc-dependent metalloprotease, partial [Longimicrobiales bacterium]